MMAGMCACNCTTEKPEDGPQPAGPETPQPSGKDVIAYVTTCDGSKLFEASGFDFGKPGSMSPYQVTYDKNSASPQIDGFGLAITTATAYNLLQMSKEEIGRAHV